MQYDITPEAFVGPGGSLPLRENDEVSWKLAMLVEGECGKLGPSAAAKKFGFSRQRYFQLRKGFLKDGGVRHRYIGDNTVRIFTDVVFPRGSVVSENIVVEGALTAGDECVFHGSVKARRNVSIGCGVVIKGNLISEGDVHVRDESVIAGLVHAERSVRLGEKVYVGLSVVANGDVELYENSEVKKNILSYGVIKTLKNPVLDFPPTVEDIG